MALLVLLIYGALESLGDQLPAAEHWLLEPFGGSNGGAALGLRQPPLVGFWFGGPQFTLQSKDVDDLDSKLDGPIECAKRTKSSPGLCLCLEEEERGERVRSR